MVGISSDIVEEAGRVSRAAATANVPMPLVGGLAIKLHATRLPPALTRRYQDIDLVTSRKGGRDTVKLLEELGYTPNDRFNAMNAGRRAVVYDVELLSGDWGLWRTSRQSVESTPAHLGELGLDDAGESVVRDRLNRLWQAVQAAPKSLRWRSRARIGDRSRWYDEPEEVDHDRTGERL